MIRTILIGLALGTALTTAAVAEPILRAEVVVTTGIVTAGDMFDDAGLYAGQALFRAPAPGTSGIVGIEAVRQAAALAGMVDFAVNGLDRIRVSRRASVVDEAMLTELIGADLEVRGLSRPDARLRIAFDTPPPEINAEASEKPASLVNLRYVESSGAFSARFVVAGYDNPLDVTGRLELMVEVPHLVESLPAGTIIGASDIEMRFVPLKVAEGAGAGALADLVGKALNRQSQAGMMLRFADVSAPVTIARNEFVTVILKSGPMTLTVRGQALSNAAEGEPISVLNLMSKKVLQGKAIGPGTVEIPAIHTAGL
jgi:flagella basal body P-ring formation protein FlgA